MQSRRSLGNSVVGVLIAACLLASAVNCISAPSFIHPCHSIDPVCLTKAANEAVDGYTNGIPELGIPLLDPYYIDRLEFNLVGMNLTFENGTLRGLKQCVVTETRTNLEERYSYSKFVCDITLKGKYSANGNILIFAIQGEGRAKLEIKSMEFESTSYWNIITKEDGKKYLDLIKDEVKYDIKEYMHFTLSNLFNGNKELTAYIHPCKSLDTVCLTKAANDALSGYINGTPELDIPLLDPYFIDRIDFDLIGLKVSFENGTLYGLRKCIIKAISISTEEKYCKINAVCDSVLKGNYRADGNVLILTIKGEGTAKIKIKEMEFKAKWFFDLEKKADGKKYIILKDGEYKYEVNENMHITLNNLFNGNKELSDVVHTFINNNWKQVFEEFGSPIVNYAIEVTRTNMKKFFGGIPAYELLEVDEFL